MDLRLRTLRLLATDRCRSPAWRWRANHPRDRAARCQSVEQAPRLATCPPLAPVRCRSPAMPPGGPVVTGTGAGSFSIIGDGGDTPRGVGAGSLSLSGSGSGMVWHGCIGVWLYIHTTPPAQVFTLSTRCGRLHPSLPMHRVPFTSRRPRRSSAGSATTRFRSRWIPDRDPATAPERASAIRRPRRCHGRRNAFP